MNNQFKHSEEFTDTINEFPNFNSILLYLLLTIVFLTVLILSLIKSPEIIIGEAKVTADKPPLEIYSQISGKLILKDNFQNKFALKDTYLGVIENPANEDDVLQLKNFLLDNKNNLLTLERNKLNFALNFNLGELEDPFIEFINVIYLLEKSKLDNELDKRKKILQNQTVGFIKLLNQKKINIEIKYGNLKNLKQKIDEDSILLSKGLITSSEHEINLYNYRREIIEKNNYEQENIENDISIIDNHQNINLLEYQKKTNISDLEFNLFNTFNQLLQAIRIWESKYVLKNPTDGTIGLMQFISSYQTVNHGDPIFSVLPLNSKTIAQVIIPPNGAGKVKIGQPVLIKLMAYPYQEFGSLIGYVKSISLIPTQYNYLILIELPNGLKSDGNHTLSFSKNMIGKAEIITEKRSLLYKLFEKIILKFERKETIPIQNKEQNQIKF